MTVSQHCLDCEGISLPSRHKESMTATFVIENQSQIDRSQIVIAIELFIQLSSRRTLGSFGAEHCDL